MSWALFLGLMLAIESHAQPMKAPSVALVLDGTEAGRFAEATGGGAEVEVIGELYPGDSIVRKRPGKVKYANITLKRGQVSDRRLHDWFDAALDGKVERKSGSIIYLDREGNEVLRLNLYEAYPAAFQAGPIPDENGELAVESFTLALAGYERIASPRVRPGPGLLPRKAFRVEIDGQPAMGALAVSESGATMEIAADGLPVVDARTLKLALDSSSDPGLHAWFREVAKGKDIRKSISVTIRAGRQGTGRVYTFLEAWPCRWKAPELNGASDTHIVEELEFAVERVERG